MIRLVQRRLIIPRGDTGSFAIPAITTSDTDNVAVFSIIDTKTKSLVFQKIVEVSEELITINFTHNDTVNLPAGDYVWDIKFYKGPVYADEELVNGEEIDSYYAGYSLPSCEIRETADKMLMSADAPSAALTAPQLDIISAALASMNDAVSETESNVEHYPRVGENNNWYLWDAETESFVDTGVSASGLGIPEGGTAGQLLKKASAEDFDTEWASETDPTVPAWAKEAQKPTYTAAEVGALPDDTVIPDIQINSTSIVDGNGVANIPIASASGPGIAYFSSQNGLSVNNDGIVSISPASNTAIKAGTNMNKPIVPAIQYASTFYGLATAAGDSTQSSSNNKVGVYTDEAKAAIQAMLDVPSNSDLTSAISSLNTMRIHICTAQEYNAETGAPTIQTPDTQTLYLVPGGEGNNLYVEWAYVGNAWERFGSADLDLSGYALKTDTVLDTTLSMGRKGGTIVGGVSTALGNNVEASGIMSFATGYNTVASGMGAHAEGANTIASGGYSHAENGANSGKVTEAAGNWSHAEGNATLASGQASHSEGRETKADGNWSHAEGRGTIANGSSSHAGGRFNVEDSYDSWPEWAANTSYVVGDKVKITTTIDNETTVKGYTCKIDNSDSEFTSANWDSTSAMNFAEIIGNGKSTSRSNARALDWDGNEYLAGDVYVRANPNSTGGVKAATVVDLESKSPAIYKTLANQSVASFTDAAQDIPLQSVVIKLAATQDETTGAISGASAASVIISSTDNALDGTTYTKTFSDPAVVYGGTYDFISGTLTITHAIKNLGDANWNTTNTNTDNKHAFISQTLYGFVKYNNDGNDTIANILCSDYDIVTVNDTLTCTKGIALGPNYTLYVYDEDYATANTATFKEAMNGVEVLYELSHPTVVQLESSRIMPLNGTTNIWAVDGTVDVTYAVDTKTYVDGKADKVDTVLLTTLSRGRKEGSTVGAESFAFGHNVIASGINSFAINYCTVASGNYSYAEGMGAIAKGNYSHAEGFGFALGANAHAEGWLSLATNQCSHAEGYHDLVSITLTAGANDTTYGYSFSSTNIVEANNYLYKDGNIIKILSVDESNNTLTTESTLGETLAGWRLVKGGALAAEAHSEGSNTLASGLCSHAEGNWTKAIANYSHAEGSISKASGEASHAEGFNTIAFGAWSHAEGAKTEANGECSHAEGGRTVANGGASHVVGYSNVPDSYASWTEWVANTTYAVGDKVKVTTTENNETVVTGYICKTANSDAEFTSSKWTQDAKMNYVEIVGNGTKTVTSNARALDWSGNEYLAGNVYVGCNSNSTGGTMLPRDIQVAGSSIVESDGVANIPIANSSTPGVVRVHSSGGIKITNGYLLTTDAKENDIQAGINNYLVIGPSRQHISTFYGLSKAAGVDLANETVTVGTYPETSKTAIRSMLGAVGDVQVNGTSIVNSGVANVPVASDVNYGVVKVNSNRGIFLHNSGQLSLNYATSNVIKKPTGNLEVLIPYFQHESTFYGLAKAAGADMKDIENTTVGTYPDAQKAAIQHMLGTDTTLADYESDTTADQAYAIGELFMLNGKLHQATAAIAINDTLTVGTNCAVVNAAEVFPHDVQVNGTSILSNGIANIPKAQNFGYGVVQGSINYGISITSDGTMAISPASDAAIKAHENLYRPIVPYQQDKSVFYGLATAAGDSTQSASNNAVGTYTDEAKAAIRTMLGTASPNVIVVQDTQPTDADTKVWIMETAPSTVQVPTVAEMNTALSGKIDDVQVNSTSVVSNGIANIPIMSYNNYGVAKIDQYSTYGINIRDDGNLQVVGASDAQYKASGSERRPVMPSHQHKSTFYGLAKAAGDTTQAASNNAVGTYTPEAKAAIRDMLGITNGSFVETVSGSTVSITGAPNTRYVCGEVSSISITPPSSGTIEVYFTSGTSPAILTLPNTVKMPEWWIDVEANYTYLISITDGVYGAVMLWAD